MLRRCQALDQIRISLTRKDAIASMQPPKVPLKWSTGFRKKALILTVLIEMASALCIGMISWTGRDIGAILVAGMGSRPIRNDAADRNSLHSVDL